MKKGFDSVSICEMSRDSNESVFTYGHWLAAMVADRQRKVKLLAIEEEMARLELEMLMERRKQTEYLGPFISRKSQKDIDRDINRFSDTYLIPALQMFRLDPFGRDKNIRTVIKQFSSTEKISMLGTTLVPSAVWGGHVRGELVYVFFREDGDTGKWYVVAEKGMKLVDLKDSLFVEIWTTPDPEESRLLEVKQRALGTAIMSAVPDRGDEPLAGDIHNSGQVRTSNPGASQSSVANPRAGRATVANPRAAQAAVTNPNTSQAAVANPNTGQAAVANPAGRGPGSRIADFVRQSVSPKH